MDQTLLKYWKTCLQDAERKAIAPKGARITLNIGDKILGTDIQADTKDKINCRL